MSCCACPAEKILTGVLFAGVGPLLNSGLVHIIVITNAGTAYRLCLRTIELSVSASVSRPKDKEKQPTQTDKDEKTDKDKRTAKPNKLIAQKIMGMNHVFIVDAAMNKEQAYLLTGLLFSP